MLVLIDPVHVSAKLETQAMMPIKATQEICFNIKYSFFDSMTSTTNDVNLRRTLPGSIRHLIVALAAHISWASLHHAATAMISHMPGTHHRNLI